MSMPLVGAGLRAPLSSLTDDARTTAASTATVTGGFVSGCFARGGATGCPDHVEFTSFPWAIAGTLGGVILDGTNIAVTFTTGCPFAGGPMSVTGSLMGGAWNGTAHLMTYASDTGLTASVAGTLLGPVTGTGTFTDTGNAMMLS